MTTASWSGITSANWCIFSDTPRLARMVLTHSGDIDPRTPGVLTITLEPMPTRRQTRAVAELCAHLTATATVFPGTDRVLRYTIKQH